MQLRRPGPDSSVCGALLGSRRAPAPQMYKAEAKAEREVSRKARQELRAARKAVRTYAPKPLCDAARQH